MEVRGDSSRFAPDVPPNRLDTLREEELLRLEPAALDDAIEANGRDGMVLYGEVQGAELVHSWHVWTVAVDGPMPRHHSYCGPEERRAARNIDVRE